VHSLSTKAWVHDTPALPVFCNKNKPVFLNFFWITWGYRTRWKLTILPKTKTDKGQLPTDKDIKVCTKCAHQPSSGYIDTKTPPLPKETEIQFKENAFHKFDPRHWSGLISPIIKAWVKKYLRSK
jgi:hypothetical protein